MMIRTSRYKPLQTTLRVSNCSVNNIEKFFLVLLRLVHFSESARYKSALCVVAKHRLPLLCLCLVSGSATKLCAVVDVLYIHLLPNVKVTTTHQF